MLAWKSTAASVPTVSSVDPPPTSTTSVDSRKAPTHASPVERQQSLLPAAKQARRDAELAAQALEKLGSVRGVSDGARGDCHRLAGPELAGRG